MMFEKLDQDQSLDMNSAACFVIMCSIFVMYIIELRMAQHRWKDNDGEANQCQTVQ